MISGSGGGGGGRGRGRGAQPPPRPLNSGPGVGAQPSDDKPKSQLSADAKEWFPPNYVPPTQGNYFPSHENTGYYNNDSRNYSGNYNYNYNNHSGSVYYAHDSDQSYPPQRYSAQDRIRFNQRSGEMDIQSSITQLVTMLDEVTFSPGRFATLSGPLVDSFSSTLDDIRHTQPLVDAIVDQAIREQNFRYNGARLCTMFDAVETEPQTQSVFRSCLLERCANEETNLVGGSDNPGDKVCGFAMFLAELYMQFENPEGGRIKALGDSLCKILKRMLSTPNSNCTKAVCQILKLSGLALDADCKLHVDDIFVGLRASEVAGVQAPLVRNLINLRQSRWGSGGFAELVDSDTTSTPTFHSQPVQQQNGLRYRESPPVNRGRNRGNDNVSGMLYLPEGHALTVEEAAFLNQHLPPSADSQLFDRDVPEDSDHDNWDPNIDDEQQADYWEFLISTNQIAR